MKNFYNLSIVLLYIHIYFIRNKYVKKVFLAEKQPDSDSKSYYEKDDNDDDNLDAAINLLSLKYTEHKSEEVGAVVEQEELGAVVEQEELGAFGDGEELGVAGGPEEVGVVWEEEELGAFGEAEELGAFGGAEEVGELGVLEEMGEVEGSKETEFYIQNNRRKRLYARKTQFDVIETKNDKETEEEAKTKDQKDELPENETSPSEPLSKDIPEKEQENVCNPDLEEFRSVLQELQEKDTELDIETIEEYLSVGVNKIREISELHKEYPLYLGKKIDFVNIRKPFGIEEENTGDKSEYELQERLYFDDFCYMPLFEFLNNTKIENLSLTTVYSLYNREGINHFPCSNSLLKYLSLKNPEFDIENFLRVNVDLYLSQEKCEVCNFDDPKFRLIKEKNVENKFVIKELVVAHSTRSLTYDEKRIIKSIIFHQIKHISHIKSALTSFAEKIKKIKSDSRILFDYFPVHRNFLYKDDILCTCLHYITCYSMVLLKPLYDKAARGQSISYREFYIVSVKINYIFAQLEFVQHNSHLYQVFCNIYKNMNPFYPRLKTVDDITPIFNYLTVRRQLFCILFNISKFFSKMISCEQIATHYELDIHPKLLKLLFSVECTHNNAKQLLKS
ncbi:hypothetical protein, conserved [Plasmodium gonderi]|uniref:KELT protein n=1 Tax=Plasmodium gonderi TaxID=77519 RepID=A0A1Y1JJV0_PLAGO|nr:hypothetical protein, conserved [Plasmodium gonderi]GAW82721.1 hypothetical protein, conserved [Plasmodium gonderi]